MPSPSPGMDPYIEAQQRFHTFHTAFITACAEVINEHQGPPYYATVEERVPIDATGPEEASRPVAHRVSPDVVVTVDGRRSSVGRAVDGAVGGAIVPVVLPQAVVPLDQPTQKLIEIRGRPYDELITTVELLSPSNKKSGPDREALLVKRADLLHRGVNVVDVDLLIIGRRLPLLVPPPAGDYYAMVTRADRRDQCEVYGWSLRERLPTVAIPMEPETADVPLDVAAAFDRVYRRFHFDRQLDHARPLPAPWPEADRAWAAERVAAVVTALRSATQ